MQTVSVGSAVQAAAPSIANSADPMAFIDKAVRGTTGNDPAALRDDAMSAMLAQLLGQKRVAVRRIPHDAASRTAIGGLDLANAAVVVLSYLELAGSPAHLRYLIKRVRQRAPAATLIVGIWPEGEAVLGNDDIRRAVGADDYVRSLREAADAAVAALHAPVVAAKVA